MTALVSERQVQEAPARLPSRRPRTAAVLAFVAIVLLATVLRVWYLGRQGLWYDEAMTGWLVRMRPEPLLDAIPRTESTPPLYYLLTREWVGVFGDTTVGLRSLSVVVGVGAVAATFAAARLLVGTGAALAAALLVAVNPLLIWYSQEARAYSLLVLGSALSLWLAARAAERPTWARLTAWAVAAGMTLWTHYFALFFIVPQGLWLLLRARGAARWRLAVQAVLIAVAAAPLIPIASEQRGHAHLFQRVALRIRVEQVGQELFGGFTPPGPAPVVWAVAAVVALAIVVGVLAGQDTATRRGARTAAAIGVAAIGVPMLLARTGHDVLDTRNVIGATVPLAVAAGAGLAVTYRRIRVVGVGVTVALAAISLALLVALVNDVPAQRPQWQRVAADLRGRGPRVILLDGGPSWHLPLAFDLPHTWWLPRSGARVRELDVVRRVSRQQCLRVTFWGASCDGRPRRLPRQLPAKGLHLVAEQRVGGYAITHYRAARRVLIRPPSRRQHRHLMLTPTAVPQMP